MIHVGFGDKKPLAASCLERHPTSCLKPTEGLFVLKTLASLGFWDEGMCIVDCKSKLIHRPGIKGNESILDERFESFPTEYSPAVQSAGSDAAGVLRLVKGKRKEARTHRESLLQGRLLLYLAGAQLTVVLEGSNSNQIIEKHSGISLACSTCLFSLLTNRVK